MLQNSISKTVTQLIKNIFFMEPESSSPF